MLIMELCQMTVFQMWKLNTMAQEQTKALPPLSEGEQTLKGRPEIEMEIAATSSKLAVVQD